MLFTLKTRSFARGCDARTSASSKRTGHVPAKAFLYQSVYQNPIATDTSAAKAHCILQLAETHDLMIVEDDALLDFRPRSLTRIATLDQLRRTIYIGSFPKSVSAALQARFLACNASRSLQSHRGWPIVQTRSAVDATSTKGSL